MMAWLRGTLIAVVLLAGSEAALACDLTGHVICSGAGLPLAGVTITVEGQGAYSSFTATAVTDAFGGYSISLPGANDIQFVATIDLSAVGGGLLAYAVASGAESFTTSSTSVGFHTGSISGLLENIDWIINAPQCSNLGCWLTGGGSKFDTTAGIYTANSGKKVNFGGNVNPGCSPTAGQGGQWSHVDHDQGLFFQGTAIQVVACGNVSGIPPGSTSPVTPYNYIRFQGTGTLKGIAGNKTPTTAACFDGYAEDRHEPGSSGVNSGARSDRYYIRVFTCSDGTCGCSPAASNTLLFLESTPGGYLGGGVDPIIIDGGNLQLHVSSCN
jgi:hypothetical protein